MERRWINMGWLVKPQKIYLDLAAGRLSDNNLFGQFLSWLRSEIAKLTHVLTIIEETHDYNDEYIHESIKAAETGLRRIRKFIDAN